MPIKFAEEYISYARQWGVGLLEIDEDKVKAEVLSPKPQTPDNAIMIRTLRRSLNLVKCVICGCVIHRFYEKQTKRFDRTNAFGKGKRLFVCSKCYSQVQLY
jgi:ribosomal protein L34E